MKNVTYNVNPATGLALMLVLLAGSCQSGKHERARDAQTKADVSFYLGDIERMNPAMDDIIPVGTRPEILAEGFEWSEGPLWIDEGPYLLFSDIPPNRMYRWSEKDSIELYLEPSGYTGVVEREGEPGSNGLLLDPSGRLVLCQHGDRRVAVMDAPLDAPAPEFITLADNYQGHRLNSPNDAVFHVNGDLYFTDPPYGLERNVDDPAKELGFQGVYRLSPEGTLTLLTDTLTRPNGIGFSPDHKILYVANSDPVKAWWVAYDVTGAGDLKNGRVFFDATSRVNQQKGLPDGLVVSSEGLIFATGPGGVWIFNPDGTHLGTIHTTQATANCTFDKQESALYITADRYLLRVRLK